LASRKRACFTSSMRWFGVALVIVLAGCGGHTTQPSSSDGTGGLGGTNATGVGGSSSGSGGAGNTANINVLLACAPPGGAQPPPRCPTEYTVGEACDAATFTLCSDLGYTAQIVCGPPHSCLPPTDAGPFNQPNPCVGSCPALKQSCSWAPGSNGGGVSPFVCCHDGDGGLSWQLGTDCRNGPA
jgi:hypothetical protein